MTLKIFHAEPCVDGVLGPGKRTVLWVQGCNIGCKGCISPHSWPADMGLDVDVAELADWIGAQREVEGITVSGGEPFQQPAALTELFYRLRARQYGVVCYTGYTYERLLCSGSVSQKLLLRQIDLLIDGPYRPTEHASCAWRGSRNQRLLCLTSRYRQAVAEVLDAGDETQGLRWFFDPLDGSTTVAGVPDSVGFRNELSRRSGRVIS